MISPPSIMCKNHLLGEHSEIHKHKHNFVKGHSIAGRIAGNAVEPAAMGARHDELVQEMIRRGYNHNSPYEQPGLDHYPDEVRNVKVNTQESLELLLAKCPACRLRYLREAVEDFS